MLGIMAGMPRGLQKYCVFLRDDGTCFRIRFDSHGLAVQHTMVSPQLQFIIKVVIFHPFRGAEATSHGLTVPADHRDSRIAVYGGQCPVVQVEHVHFPVVADSVLRSIHVSRSRSHMYFVPELLG